MGSQVGRCGLAYAEWPTSNSLIPLSSSGGGVVELFAGEAVAEAVVSVVSGLVHAMAPVKDEGVVDLFSVLLVISVLVLLAVKTSSCASSSLWPLSISDKSLAGLSTGVVLGCGGEMTDLGGFAGDFLTDLVIPWAGREEPLSVLSGAPFSGLGFSSLASVSWVFDAAQGVCARFLRRRA